MWNIINKCKSTKSYVYLHGSFRPLTWICAPLHVDNLLDIHTDNVLHPSFVFSVLLNSANITVIKNLYRHYRKKRKNDLCTLINKRIIQSKAQLTLKLQFGLKAIEGLSIKIY